MDNLTGATLFAAYRPLVPGGKTTSGGKVTAITDFKNSNNFISKTSGQDPEEGGSGQVLFNGSRLLKSNAASSTYDFMCNGSSYCIDMWIKQISLPPATRTILTTRVAGTTDSGFNVVDLSGNSNAFGIRDGASNTLFGSSSSFYDLNISQLVVVYEDNGVGNPGATIYYNGTQIYQINGAIATNPSNTAFTTLFIGGNDVGTVYGNFELYDCHIFTGVPTAGDLTTIFNTSYYQ